MDRPTKWPGKIIEYARESILLSMIFFVPLVFAFLWPDNNVFELDKTAAFKALVVVLVLLSALEFALAGPEQTVFNWRAKLGPYRSALWPLAGLLSVMALATAFAIDPGLSWAGAYNRQQGLEFYIYLAVFFICLLYHLDSRAKIGRLLLAAFAAGTIAGIYGLAQWSGYDPLPWNDPSGLRVSSTLGQPNFFGHFLLLTIPLASYLYSRSRRVVGRVLIIAAAWAQAAALYLTYSRGAELGLAAGLVAGAAIWLFERERGRRRPRIKWRYLAFIAAAAILIVVMLGNDRLIFKRWSDVYRGEDGGLYLRLEYWRSSWELWRDRPWLGFGLDSQGETLIDHYRGDWAKYESLLSYPNRAHNWLFDTLITGGVIGLAAWSLFLSRFRALWATRDDKWFFYPILCALVGFAVSLMVGFSVVTTDIYLALYLALVLAMAHLKGPARTPTLAPPRAPGQPLVALWFGVFLAAGLGAVLISGQIDRLRADHYYYLAKSRLATQELPAALGYFLRVRELAPAEHYYNAEYAQLLAAARGRLADERITRIVDVLLAEIGRGLGHGFQDEIARIAIGTALNDQESRNEADAGLVRLLEKSPEYWGIRFLEVRLRLAQGRLDSARTAAIAIIADLPDPNAGNLSRFNRESLRSGKRQALELLGDIAGAEGRNGEAAATYQEAYRWQPEYFRLYDKIAHAQLSTGDRLSALGSFERGAARAPKDHYWAYQTAKLADEMGKTDIVRIYSIRAFELAPSIKEIAALYDKYWK